MPLASASWDRWLALEKETATPLLTRTGGLYGGPHGSAIVAGARDSVGGHGVAHEILDADEIHRRWPIFEPAGDTVAVLDFGRKIAEGAPASVREYPAVIAAYLGTTEAARA